MADWITRHNAAMEHPMGVEAAIVGMFIALCEYPTFHHGRYDWSLADDTFLADHWIGMARGFIGLLNGETGRLDCSILDGDIRAVAVECGFKEDLSGPS